MSMRMVNGYVSGADPMKGLNAGGRRAALLVGIAAGAVIAAAGDASAQPGQPEQPERPEQPEMPAGGPPGAPAAGHRATSFLVRMGLDFGGEELADVRFSDGSSKTLTAGGRYWLAAGFLYHPGSWSIEGTLGYKTEGASASNGSIDFSRYPIDLIVSFAPGGVRVGAGPTLHLSPSIDCSAGFCGRPVSIAFDHALGVIAQAAAELSSGSHGAELGIRYTKIRYTVDGVGVDGSSFGCFVGGRL